MGIIDRSSGGSTNTNMINLFLRTVQMIFAIAILGFYAAYLHSNFNVLGVLTSHLTLGITAGCLSLVTAVAFGLIPLFISYHPVALAFVWDWIIFFIWCAVFGWMRYTFDHPTIDFQGSPYRTDALRFRQMVWVDLTSMLLWLASAIMGPVCLLMDRRGLRFGRSGA